LEEIEKELLIKRNQTKRAKRLHHVEIKKESKQKMGDDPRYIESLQKEYLRGFDKLEETLTKISMSEDPLRHPLFDDAMRYPFLFLSSTTRTR